MKCTDQRKMGIVLLWVWIILECVWLVLYFFGHTTGKEFLMGTITSLLGVAGSIATMRRASKKAKQE